LEKIQMAKRDPVSFTTPVGRLVWGSVHEAQAKKDQAGKDKLVASGANAGQVLKMFDFGIAIPKTQQHWASEPDWGQKIWAEGHGAWPNGQAQRADFSWKVTDGDSAIPNKKGIKPCDRQGYPGCWVLAFSGMGAPAIYDSTSGAVLPSNVPDLIQPGDEVQVNGSVVSNESDQTAGVYLNHHGVCWRGRSAKGRISVGPQVDTSGFGAGVAPGATAAAPALANAVPGAPAAPGVPAAPAAPVTAPPVPAAAPIAAPTVPVVPNPAYTPAGAVSPAPAVPTPPAPQAPAAPAGPVVTAKAAAEGLTYAALKGAGWNDDQMRQAGYIA
jgi:hypothetical protein